MSTIFISNEQLLQGKALVKQGNVTDAWNLLSQFGDDYPAAAYQGIAEPTYFYEQVIRNSWAVADASLSAGGAA